MYKLPKCLEIMRALGFSPCLSPSFIAVRLPRLDKSGDSWLLPFY